MINFDVVYALLRRNVQSYFSGVLGYLVIVLFVTVAAFCAFSPRFFTYNLANLDQLSEVFPILLLALVPAITMSVWADERKLGTDEILFTLPARDFEVLLGKYLSVLGIYTIALVFSVTQLVVLAWIGNPDWGVVLTTYLGYWLAGAALLSAGMFASALTSSTTVAYVLGATLCAIPVFVGQLAPSSTFLQSLSLSTQLRDFTSGLIPLSGVLYFVGLTAFMLYLNMILITSRHWRRTQGAAMGGHFAVRVLFLAVGLISLNSIADRSAGSFISRADLTAEGLYTLSSTTRQTLKEAKQADRVVTIQAFVSPEVPQEFVFARKQLVGLLRQYDRIGGNMVDVRFVDVEANSTAAKEARTLGVEPRRSISEIAGKQIEEDVYLGCVITSNLGEVVLPFLDGVTSMEYELTYALSNVTQRDDRLTIGMLATDALRLRDPPGQPSVRSFFSRTLEALEQQYELLDVTPEELAEISVELSGEGGDESESDEAGESEEDESNGASEVPDVLVVVQPSSLTQAGMAALVEYIELGQPVLLVDDPLPFFPYVFYRPEDIGVVNAPLQPRPTPDSGLSWITTVEQAPVPPQLQAQLMQMQQQLQRLPPQFAQQMMQRFYAENPAARPRFIPKADGGTAASLMETIGVEWEPGRVAWDIYNPHPDFKPFWIREIFGEDWPASYGPQQNTFLFVGQGNGAEATFNREDPISSGLQELMFCYPGSIEWGKSSKLTVTPLVTTGKDSGLIDWDRVTYTETVLMEQPDPLTGGVRRVPQPQRSPYTNQPLRRIEKRPQQSFDDDVHVLAARIQAAGDEEDSAAINVVFVADIDFMSDFYFEQQGVLEKQLDNLPFLFNAIETLAGDASMVALRNRRAEPRRLVAIQDEIEFFRRQRSEEQQTIEAEIRDELDKAREELEAKEAEIASDDELGFLQKFGELGEAADVAQQEFDLQKERLEEQLQIRIDELKAVEQQSVNNLESRVRTAAVLLPPLPALFLGLAVLLSRIVGERQRIASTRRRS